MKNLIFISTLLTAGTLAATAATTLNYENIGNFKKGFWWPDNQILLRSFTLDQYSGFYTFETSNLDFSNIESATFNVGLFYSRDDCNLKIWAVARDNTDLSADIAKEIISSANMTNPVLKPITSTQFKSITSTQSGYLLSIDLTSELKNIANEKDVAILISIDKSETDCCLDHGVAIATLEYTMTSVPEPSMFGLLAGTLALALAGTRRRRRK